jgi:choline dehydrogenase-like flavoprotein
VVVVGSGASAVHFSLSVLEKGHEVLMLDVGRRRPDPVRPEDSFEDLKRNLDDPVKHLLGENFEAVTYPGGEGEYYGFPPNKSYVFEGVGSHRVRASGFSPLSSFAQGGLAEAWTGGVFPFNDGELADFPFSFADLSPHYDRIAERIGIAGCEDDLARHIPLHRHLQQPLELDEHSRRLLAAYESRREWFRSELGCTLGRSRIATLSAARDGRPACGYLGRCLLGCPTDSLYTPVLTLRRCVERAGFTYVRDVCVRHFVFDEDRDGSRRVRSVVADRLDGKGRESFEVERLVLGAGTLSSTKIFLESWARAGGGELRLRGLMDNRQILMPFVNLGMLRRPHDPRTYQYHQLTIGMEAEDPRDYVHGLVTTLKTASIHPIVQSLPLDLRSALHVFRNAHAALGLVNVNFPDRRRETSWVALGKGERDGESALIVRYEPPERERELLARTRRRFRKALRALGCVVPPGMSHVRPMGASVHYAGTLPMTAQERPFTTTPEGRSREFENLWFVDGTTFPFLPAKNLTFTLMANAARIAERAF